MINNLNTPDLESRTWKCVDDVSLPEGFIGNSNQPQYRRLLELQQLDETRR